MGFFNRESEEEKIAKIKALREQRKAVDVKYNQVQKRKALDRIYRKEKAELEERKMASSGRGHIIGAVASAAKGFAVITTPKKDDFIDRMAKSKMNQQMYGAGADPLGNSKYKKTSYDPIWGTPKKKGKKNEPFIGF